MLEISVAGQGGKAVGELIDANPDGNGRDQFLANISTRGQAGGLDAPLTLNFTISGKGGKKLLIRGLGPSLAKYGMRRSLARPLLQIWRNGMLVTSNAGWRSSGNSGREISAAEGEVGASPLEPGDAGLVLPVSPGNYKVSLLSPDGRPGTGLIEVFDLSTHF
jgi:hypothetical protein